MDTGFFDWLGRNTNEISAMATAAVAVLTLCTVLLTRYISNVTKLMIQSQIIVDMRRRYADPEMLHAMKALRAWQSNHGEDFAKVFLADRERPDTEAWKLDPGRRIISHYFFDAFLLFRVGALNRRLLRNLLLKYHFQFFFEVLAPIEMGIGSDNETRRKIAEAISVYRSLYGSSSAAKWRGKQ